MNAMQSTMRNATQKIAQNATRVSGKPSYVNFDIEFLPEGTSATDMVMVITPDDGDAFLEPVRVPGPRDNRVVWRSKTNFRIKLVHLDDQSMLLRKSDKILLEKDVEAAEKSEDRGWFSAEQVGDNNWVCAVTLMPCSDNELKRTVAVKYFVKHVRSEVIFDPVLIISH